MSFFSFIVSYDVRARNSRDIIPRTETRIQKGRDVNKARAAVEASLRHGVKELVPESIVFDGTSEVVLSPAEQRLRAVWQEVIKAAANALAPRAP